MKNEPSAVVMIAVSIVVLIVGAIVRGFVISSLWSWFIVSAFSVPAIGMSTALGISLLASLFTTTPPADKNEEFSSALSKSVGTAIGGPLVTLALGWLLRLASS